jgi:hypothetical protein
MPAVSFGGRNALQLVICRQQVFKLDIIVGIISKAGIFGLLLSINLDEAVMESKCIMSLDGFTIG